MTHFLLTAPSQLITAAAGPQSASWTLMIVVAGVVGAILRRRRAALALAS